MIQLGGLKARGNANPNSSCSLIAAVNVLFPLARLDILPLAVREAISGHKPLPIRLLTGLDESKVAGLSARAGTVMKGLLATTFSAPAHGFVHVAVQPEETLLATVDRDLKRRVAAKQLPPAAYVVEWMVSIDARTAALLSQNRELAVPEGRYRLTGFTVQRGFIHFGAMVRNPHGRGFVCYNDDQDRIDDASVASWKNVVHVVYARADVYDAFAAAVKEPTLLQRPFPALSSSSKLPRSMGNKRPRCSGEQEAEFSEKFGGETLDEVLLQILKLLS